MTKNDFLKELVEVLQRDKPIDENMRLEDIDEYDSMSMLNIIVLIDTEFGKLLTTEELESCEYVKDIIKLVEKNID